GSTGLMVWPMPTVKSSSHLPLASVRLDRRAIPNSTYRSFHTPHMGKLGNADTYRYASQSRQTECPSERLNPFYPIATRCTKRTDHTSRLRLAAVFKTRLAINVETQSLAINLTHNTPIRLQPVIERWRDALVAGDVEQAELIAFDTLGIVFNDRVNSHVGGNL